MNNVPPIINKLLSNNQILGNSIVQNAIQMSQNNNLSGLEELANNIAKEKGTTVADVRKQLNI